MNNIDTVCDGIASAGYTFFVGRVASIIKEAMINDRDSVDIEKLLKAFNDAKEYTEQERL